MKRRNLTRLHGTLIAVLCLSALFLTHVCWGQDEGPIRFNVPSPPVVAAASAILMDATTGTVLWEQNADQPRPPASLTKVMTALLILEGGRLGDWVTVTPTVLEGWGSCAGLKPGERIVMRDLLYAILLKSANDACLVAAEYVDGSVTAFVEHMNQRARKLGATNTHFVNPHGLHDDAHVSTARDMAAIARCALQNVIFRTVSNRKTETIHWQGYEGRNTLQLINKNKLLWRYDEADGVKTGYTKQAGNCLIASATRGDWQLLSVVMKSPGTWDESEKLLRYGFNTFRDVRLFPAEGVVTTVKIRKGARPALELVAKSALAAVVPAGREGLVHYHNILKLHPAPIRAGEQLGWVVAENHGHELARVPLVAARPVEKALVYQIIPRLLLWGGVALGILCLRNAYAKTAKGPRRRRRRVSSRR